MNRLQMVLLRLSVAIDASPPICFNPVVETEAYISLGSNIGDRELNLLRSVAEIGRLPQCRVTSLSSFYETSPVGPVKQEMFYNAVLKLSTGLDAVALLNQLLRIEKDLFHRTREIPAGPRRMDLDILLFGNEIISNDFLCIPHPRLAERRFVLKPLAEIAPDLVHPILGKSIGRLLAELVSDEKVKRID